MGSLRFNQNLNALATFLTTWLHRCRRNFYFFYLTAFDSLEAAFPFLIIRLNVELDSFYFDICVFWHISWNSLRVYLCSLEQMDAQCSPDAEGMYTMSQEETSGFI